MIRDIDVALLRAFLMVVDTGGVTTASRLLNRTQAAVSQQIKRLEELFGAELFLREHKRLTLAPAGERLLGQARQMIALNDQLWGQMTRPDFEGEVRLGVPMDIVSSYVPTILRRFNHAWPRVRVMLVCENSHELLEQLASGQIDLTLTTDTTTGPGATLLRRDRLVWVGSPGTEAHRQRPLPVSIGSRTCRFRPVVLAALRQAGLDWRFVIEVANQDAVYATIAAGIAVGAVLEDSLPGNMQILDAKSGLPPLPEFLVNLFLPATGASEIATELASHIRQDFALRFGSPDNAVLSPSRTSPANWVAAARRAASGERV
jgi:DNA-binding transcriptional LysR family regulator